MTWIHGLGAVLAMLLLLGLAAEALCGARDRKRFLPPGRMIGIGGRRMHLLCQGEGRGPTVIVEQGAGCPSLLWWRIQEQVSAFTAICLYDRAGYLWSDPAPVRGPSGALHDRVADLHDMLHASGLPAPFILVGHSFGGPLIRCYTAAYPAEIAGLVLVDTTPEEVIFRASYDSYARKLGLIIGAARVLAQFGLLRLTALFLRKPPGSMPHAYFRALKAALVRPAFFRAMASDPGALSHVPPSMRHDTGFGHDLGDMPVIVLTHDQPFPGAAAVLEDGWAAAQARIARQSSRGELRVATGCNHMIPFEAPELVVDAIRCVVEQVRTSISGQRAETAVTQD